MGKIVLLTGAGGFLGKIIAQQLEGYTIRTLGRTDASHYRYNLAEEKPAFDLVFDLVVHAAGKAHIVPQTEQEKQDFFKVNHQGTLNLLTALEANPPKSFILVSTVAVYGKDTGILIPENAPLTAKDPYGQSKILAEKAVLDWCTTHNVICTVLRLPLIAGPNPPGNLHAMISGINNGKYANIAGGKARKSIVLAADIARIIPVVAEKGGIYNLTDGQHPSFYELSQLIAKQLGKGQVRNIPHWMAALLACAGNILGPRFPVNSNKLRKITLDLTFDDSNARHQLNWKPTPVLEGFKIS